MKRILIYTATSLILIMSAIRMILSYQTEAWSIIAGSILLCWAMILISELGIKCHAESKEPDKEIKHPLEEELGPITAFSIHCCSCKYCQRTASNPGITCTKSGRYLKSFQFLDMSTRKARQFRDQHPNLCYYCKKVGP